MKRLKTLQNKFEKNGKLLDNYNAIIKEQFQTHVIEKNPETSHNPAGGTHYLPHRPVVRENMVSGKTRMVFDASSRSSGPSLNDCLHSGPSLTEPLLAILLRFYVFIESPLMLI